MKNSGNSRLRSALILAAMMFGAMVTAFAQQEVDPSWYDPWTPPTAAQTAQKQVAAPKKHQTARHNAKVGPDQRTAKNHTVAQGKQS